MPDILQRRGLLDMLASLKQPAQTITNDLKLWARYTQERRRQARAGDIEGALLAEAKLVREVQLARESMSTYARVDRLMKERDTDLEGGQTPERMVMFVGQSRSGHSLVGSLIDAHPDAVIAHEIHALKHLLNGSSFEDVSRAIMLNAHLFDMFGRAYTGYDYHVPGQSQGRCRRLRVIGDKKGNGTTRQLRRRPDALDWLDRHLPVKLQLINVIRDPFDNIATKAKRTGTSLSEAARRFLTNARTLDDLRRRRPDQVKTVYLDDLIATPKPVLEDLLTWLSLSTDEPGYLDACAGLVFDRPKRTRDEVSWSNGLVDALRLEIQRLPDLARFADEQL